MSSTFFLLIKKYYFKNLWTSNQMKYPKNFLKTPQILDIKSGENINLKHLFTEFTGNEKVEFYLPLVQL